MACKSCGVGGCGTPKNIDTKENNTTTTTSSYSCSNEGGCGCNKLNSYDWLMDMDIPVEKKYPYIEVKFRNGRKEFAHNNLNIELITGQYVIMDMPQTGGYDMGTVSLQGELVRLQMLKKKVKVDSVISKILRLATEKDIEKAGQVQSRNMSTLFRARQIVKDTNLNMKLSDVEHQADGSRILFYYSAEDRVDFRELIKVLALEFRSRIEMKQISTRQEASRIGGLGVCGRELCCSTWLTDFKNVVNSAARYQNLSINSNKLAGQCGRLKCCLNYELDTYMEALKDIPKIETLRTQKGIAKLYKTDIFRKIMWFGFSEEGWIAVPLTRVLEIMDMNAKGIEPANLLENEVETKQNASSSILLKLEKQEKRHKIDIMREKAEQNARKEKREKTRSKRNKEPRPKMNATENDINNKTEQQKTEPKNTENQHIEKPYTPLRNNDFRNSQRNEKPKNNPQNQNNNKNPKSFGNRNDKIPFDMPIPDFDDLKNQKPQEKNQQKPQEKYTERSQEKTKNQPNEKINPQPKNHKQHEKPQEKKENQNQENQKIIQKKPFNLPKLPEFTELPPEKKQNQQPQKKQHKNQHQHQKNQQNENQNIQNNPKHPPRQNL